MQGKPTFQCYLFTPVVRHSRLFGRAGPTWRWLGTALGFEPGQTRLNRVSCWFAAGCCANLLAAQTLALNFLVANELRAEVLAHGYEYITPQAPAMMATCSVLHGLQVYRAGDFRSRPRHADSDRAWGWQALLRSPI